MALTRPTIQNINTNLVAFTDSLTITNFGNVANRDIGEIFDRSQGGGSNVAIIWNEATQSFRMAYTSSTGRETGNLTLTSNANLIVGELSAGNITTGNLTVTNITYETTEYVSASEVVSGNSTVNALTVNTSATIGTTLSVTGNITSGNIVPSANATYSIGSPTQRYKSLYLSGNTIYMDGTTISSNATSITFTNPNGGSFIVGGTTTITANATSETAQYVTQATQSNITSVGTLTSLTLSGTLTGTTLNAANFGNAGAIFTGAYFNAAGSFYGPLSGVIGADGANTALVTTLTSTGNAAVSALTVNGTATVGSTLGVTGNVYTGNIYTNGLFWSNGVAISTGGSGSPGGSPTQIQYNNNGSFGGISGFTWNGTTLTAAQGLQNTPIGNATASSGAFTTINATGAITGATTIVTTGAATASAITSNSTISAGTTLSATGGIQNTVIGNVTPAAGYHTTINATGAITGATTIITTGAATHSAVTSNGSVTLNSANGVTALINGGSAGTGNIGASGQGFNTVFAKATSAQYADLAEKYSSDADYAPGTVVIFGGTKEITISSKLADNKVAGVISTNPAYQMNSDLVDGLYVALAGRVPCNVVGKIEKGNMLITSRIPGVATASDDPRMGQVIGKALADYDSDGVGIIEVVVGRM